VPFPSGLITRPPVADDLGFVIKAWVRSYANSPYAGSMSRERQVTAIRGTIFDLIKRGAEVKLVCLSARPDFILGFICSEQSPDGPIVHYVYVKNNFRQSGIGSGLVESICAKPDVQVKTSHRTPLGDCLFKSRQYNPKLSRYQKEGGVSGRVPSPPDADGADPSLNANGA
jgi:hypothetical protein